MHTFQPDWKPDYHESFVAGLHLRSAILNREFDADEQDAIHWQRWIETNGNKMAFARGMACADAYCAIRHRPAPKDAKPIAPITP